MDILKRLYNIARAEMPERDSDRGDHLPEDGEKPYCSDRFDREKASSQDPVLAGYYANLELPYGADMASVRQSWKRMMKQYHPDMHSTDAQKKEVAGELSAELTRAYQELSRALATRP